MYCNWDGAGGGSHPFDAHADLTTYTLWQMKIFNTKLSGYPYNSIVITIENKIKLKLKNITYVTISHDLLMETSVQ